MNSNETQIEFVAATNQITYHVKLLIFLHDFHDSSFKCV